MAKHIKSSHSNQLPLWRSDACRKWITQPIHQLTSIFPINHDAVIDKIKQLPSIQETTRQARAATYISFTRYLSRRFPKVFKKATPSREGVSKTFFRVHEKVVTEAMNQSQWLDFCVV